MRHRVIPLVLWHADGFQEYVCLECGRPASPARQQRWPDLWRHHQRPFWKPLGKAA